jgi:hypothetical protein
MSRSQFHEDRRARRLGAKPACRLARAWTLAMAVMAAAAAGEPAKEYQVKAAFIYNFIKFTEWPAEAQPEAGAPITIGIVGTNPFGDDLAQMVKNKPINGHPVAVRACATAEELKGCHVAFISNVPEAQVDAAVALAREACVLTVGESDAFAKAGGMIRFAMDKDKVRFEINAGSASEAKIRISAQLQKLASAVHGVPPNK